MDRLFVTEADVRRFGKGNMLGVLWRQWRGERRLRRRGIHFRHTDSAIVAAAYQAMSEADFEAINSRQDWANWRTIPRSLSGHVPDRPLRILDLGCGSGGSTQVLAFYAPAGSHITGYEIAEPLLTWARQRCYRQQHGELAKVDFIAQAVTEPWRDGNGSVLTAGSVDVVNASGIVGHHLNEETMPPVIREVKGVLNAEGIACLDVGPTMRSDLLRRLMEDAGFRTLGRYRSWFGDPTGQMVFGIVPQMEFRL